MYPGSVWTTLSAINNMGQVVGDYSTESLAAGKPVRSFVHTLDRRSVNAFVVPEGPENTSPLAINDVGQVGGYYYDREGGGHGFVRSADGRHFESIDHPKGVIETSVFGINKAGQISGFYIDGDKGVHGYVRSADDKSFTDFDHPDGVGQTYAKSIDDSGRIVGHYRDKSGLHAFVRSPDGKDFERIDHPDAARAPDDGGTCGQALNARGEVAGFYYTDGKVSHGFVRSADGKNFNTIDHPEAVSKTGGTSVFGMNDKGQVVGYYTDASGNFHGFIATPRSY